MKQLLFFILNLCSFSNLAFSQCTPNSTNIYTFITNGIKYEIIKEKLNWVNAAACAVTRGGKLAEINSQAEQDTLYNRINSAGITASNTVAPDGGGASYLWLGGNDLSIEGKWIWDGDNTGAFVQFWQGTASGSPVGGLYNNWGNEPDDYTGQDALGFAFTNWPLGIAGEWNDIKESNLLYYIIEYSGTTSISEMKSNEFLVYPNPVEDFITLAFNKSSPDLKYNLSNLNGKILLQGILTNTINTIDISSLIPGIYFVDVNGSKHKILKTVK
ncbi:MAG: T9SS type A sorting domain-containing protein [Bacteroidota bacterium]|nr:T9SS type A sorting domain-containing protein [Bacteroidota bacterium]